MFTLPCEVPVGATERYARLRCRGMLPLGPIALSHSRTGQVRSQACHLQLVGIRGKAIMHSVNVMVISGKYIRMATNNYNVASSKATQRQARELRYTMPEASTKVYHSTAHTVHSLAIPATRLLLVIVAEIHRSSYGLVRGCVCTRGALQREILRICNWWGPTAEFSDDVEIARPLMSSTVKQQLANTHSSQHQRL